MNNDPAAILSALLASKPTRTVHAPKMSRGIYGLIDHFGDLRYIGSTSSLEQTIYERIHQRHRTGSEGMSHYFSNMYNVGRMWRDRKDPSTAADGSLAKALRNAFVAHHCAAVWVELADDEDIAGIEQQILRLAPPSAIAWNGRKSFPYEEPVALVNATIEKLGWGYRERDAVERQGRRFLGLSASEGASANPKLISDFLTGPFRFVALDVETANNDRSSICQIGLAGVRADNSIQVWKTYVNPHTDKWPCSWIHGITAEHVVSAPTFSELLPVLDDLLSQSAVYQHSAFDMSAIAAACRCARLTTPNWEWKNSIEMARQAWPELKTSAGYGLASLKRHLNLRFDHHDAGEDARACAEVVLKAEEKLAIQQQEKDTSIAASETVLSVPPVAATTQEIVLDRVQCSERLLGITQITEGNIRHDHIYLRSFIEKFPADAIGGSNHATAAHREVTLHWGNPAPVLTDLDGTKKMFRKRGWTREFFERNQVRPGDRVAIFESGPYQYRVEVVLPKASDGARLGIFDGDTGGDAHRTKGGR
jgi:DNA polymerase-3 subunit epsilon